MTTMIDDDEGEQTLSVQSDKNSTRWHFLGDRLQNGSPYAIGPLSVCLPVLSDIGVL